MIQDYCKAAKMLTSTPWKYCQFLQGELCNLSGSCPDKVDEKHWKWLQSQEEPKER